MSQLVAHSKLIPNKRECSTGKCKPMAEEILTELDQAENNCSCSMG